MLESDQGRLARFLCLPLQIFAVSTFVAEAAGCRSAFDCGLNGDCLSGSCLCDAAWKGDTCTVLNLIPMEPDVAKRGAYREGTRTSWGASVHHSEEDNHNHMFAAEMKGARWPTWRTRHARCTSIARVPPPHLGVTDAYHYGAAVLRHRLLTFAQATVHLRVGSRTRR